MSLRIAPDLELPDAALESHIAVLGKTGSGKSNLAKVVVEGLLDQGARVCVLDPTGTWYGLRLTREMEPSPYQVVMFGGNHADVAIGASHGAAVAEVIGTTATPAVIDTRTMTVGQRTEFFADFAETLLQRNRGPLHLVVDEAHVFAPQGRVSDPMSGRMVGAANNLVSLGRGIGLRIILISQRPAKLHKDSLTQVETLVAMRLIAPQDTGAVDDWIGEWADRKQGAELKASLPALRTGEAWIWSPGADILQRTRVPLARTLDTGRPSDAAIELAAIDVAGIQERLATASGADTASAEGGRPMRAAKLLEERDRRIADLERQLRERPAVEPERVEVPVVTDDHVAALRAAADEILTALRRVSAPTTDPTVESGRVADGPRSVPVRASAPIPAGGDVHTVAAARPLVAARPARDGTASLGKAERSFLAALAQFPDGRNRNQAAFLAGYGPKLSTTRGALATLRKRGLIEGAGTDTDLLRITPAGVEDLGPFELAPTGRALAEWWMAKLPTAPRMFFGALLGAHPTPLTRAQAAAAAGYDPAISTTRGALATLRTQGLITGGSDALRLSPDLVDDTTA